MATNPEHVRESLWRERPPLPRGVELLRQDTLLVPRRGPGGQDVYDLAQVALPGSQVPVLVGYRAPLLPVDVPRLRDRLRALDEELRRRESTGRVLPAPRVPLIATNAAGEGVLSACEREDVALVDLRGTLLLRSGTAFIRVLGQQPRQRSPREPLFHGKGCRLVRVLLGTPGRAWTGRALSERTQTSYAYTHGVLTQLEQQGYVERASRNTGFRVRDAVGLLRAWMDSGKRTAVTVDAFNAPATTPEALQRGFAELRAGHIRAAFTLASGLLPEERFVSGLPHGLYLSGSVEPVVQAFGLRRLTPHNFWVLRPEVAAETEAGGVYDMLRELPQGPGVALPQLAVDSCHAGGRGREQAEALLERFARSLPLLEGPT